MQIALECLAVGLARNFLKIDGHRPKCHQFEGVPLAKSKTICTSKQ